MQRKAFTRTDHGEERESERIRHEQDLAGKISQSSDEKREQSNSGSIEQVSGAAEPDDGKIANEQIADGPAPKGRNQGEDQHAEEINALTASSQDTGDGGNRSAEMLKPRLKREGGQLHFRITF